MISVENLTYRYEVGAPDALHSINLRFAEGSFTAIMGANGSGKSTLARCLNGLLLPNSGSVIVNGMRTSDPIQRSAMRRAVGFVFQDPNMQMTSATIERELAFGLQNLEIPRARMHNIVSDELEQLGLLEKRVVSPAMLSGGEKQRLALASVLLLAPSYVVLDEPTSHLSPSSRRRIIASLRVLQKEKNVGIILVTQFFEETAEAERLTILDRGSVVFDDVPINALARAGEFTARGIRMRNRGSA